MRTEDSAPPKSTGRPAHRWVWTALSYSIGLACLYWVFHDIQLHELFESLARANWWWVLPAVVLTLLVYVCTAWEWQLLLRPAGYLSFAQTTKAVFAGRFANDILPVHVGYVVRIYLASRWIGSPVAPVISSLLIERLFDALWLVLGIGITVLFFPLPEEFVRFGEVLGGIILLGGAAVTWMIVHDGRGPAEPEPVGVFRWKPVRKVYSFFGKLAQGVRGIGRSWLLPAALVLSVLKLAAQCLAFLALLWGYGFSFSIWVQLTVFLIAYIGMSMPSTPAGVGVFQLFCAAGLRLFGVPKPAASGFALLAFVILTAPLITGGFIALTRTGLSWRQLRSEILAWKDKGEE